MIDMIDRWVGTWLLGKIGGCVDGYIDKTDRWVGT